MHGKKKDIGKALTLRTRWKRYGPYGQILDLPLLHGEMTFV